MLHFSPWSQKMDPLTNRFLIKAQQSLSPTQQPKTGRFNSLSLQQYPRRMNSQYQKHQNSILEEKSKQYNNACSQTDLPSLEIEGLLNPQQQEQSSRKYQQALLQTQNHHHQSTIISLLQTVQFKSNQLQTIKSKAQQPKRVIVQNRNRTITVIVVNNAAQFVSFLLNSNYFDQIPGHFFNTQYHPSFFITKIIISNSNSSDSVHSYQDLLNVTKKNRIYNVNLNRILNDQSQSFIHYCPDIIIVTIGNFQEELSNKQRDKSFFVRSEEQIEKETIKLNKKRTKFKLKDLN